MSGELGFLKNWNTSVCNIFQLSVIFQFGLYTIGNWLGDCYSIILTMILLINIGSKNRCIF